MQGPASTGLWGGIGIGVAAAAGTAAALPTLAAGIIAIAGGAGLMGGAVITDRMTSGRRKLTDKECSHCEEVFRGTVDLSKVRITRDSMISLGAPKGVGNVIHLKSTWGHFEGNGLELSDWGFEILVHELAHVWQFQNAGTAYIPKSLWAQYASWRATGSRSGAYDWLSMHQAEVPWELWNPEHQAKAVEQYNRILMRKMRNESGDDDEEEWEILHRYMPNVWSGFGAPRWRKNKPATHAEPES